MAWLIAGSIIGGLISANASQNAANTQAGAAQNAANQQQAAWNTANQQQMPWIQAGQNAVSQMANMTGPGGFMSTMPTAAQIMSQFAPNYQFQLQQGLGQAGNMANATGGLLSGNALQGLNTFAQNYAGNAYQNAFQNYQTGQTNIFNRLASIAGLGQTSAGQSMQGGLTAAQNIGNFNTSAAAAQAAGQVGTANAINNTVGNLSSLAYLQGLNNNPSNVNYNGGTTGMPLNRWLSTGNQ